MENPLVFLLRPVKGLFQMCCIKLMLTHAQVAGLRRGHLKLNLTSKL